MNDKEKLQLQQMITENNVEDQTGLIRELKHSVILRDEINKLVLLKSKYESEEDLNLEGMIECNFLFTYYTDIYNKVRKDEVDYTILFQFLDVLKKIEDGLVDQHEGSYEVGTLLKKLYVDSAIRKADKINAKYDDEQVSHADVVDISWKKFKAMNRK
jgi:hypothetical protein